MNAAATPLVVGLLAGAALGAVYFLWLWWSLQGLVDRRRGGFWFMVNAIGRMALALACFAVLARWGSWVAVVSALAAFFVTRVVLTRRLTLPRPGRGGST